MGGFITVRKYGCFYVHRQTYLIERDDLRYKNKGCSGKREHIPPSKRHLYSVQSDQKLHFIFDDIPKYCPKER